MTARTDSNYDVNANTVAYYKLNDNSNDTSGNGNNGTDTNITYVAGKFGNCASFNGSSSFVNLSALDIQSATSWTLSLWVNANNVNIHKNIIRFEKKFIIQMNEAGIIKYYIIDSGGTIREISVTQTYISNTWYHLTITQTGNTTNCFLNGVLIGSSSSYSTFTGTKGVQYLGREAAGYYHTGLIDEVIIENTARTAAQVLDYYNKSQERFLGEYLGAGTATTKGLYHLNGNSNDASGNGNNGTDSNISYVAGRFGNCGSFNGNNSKITAGTNAIFASTDLSIFCWVNFNALNERQYLILASSGIYELICVRLSNFSGAWRLCFITGAGSGFSDGGDDSEGIAATNFDTGKWYHVGFTQTGKTIRQYVNGKEFSNYTSAGNFKTFTGSYVGLLGRTDGDSLNGLLDEVIIENRAWTPVEIQKYYTYAKGRFGIT